MGKNALLVQNRLAGSTMADMLAISLMLIGWKLLIEQGAERVWLRAVHDTLRLSGRMRYSIEIGIASEQRPLGTSQQCSDGTWRYPDRFCNFGIAQPSHPEGQDLGLPFGEALHGLAYLRMLIGQDQRLTWVCRIKRALAHHSQVLAPLAPQRIGGTVQSNTT
jgi:hypothetical protein